MRAPIANSAEAGTAPSPALVRISESLPLLLFTRAAAAVLVCIASLYFFLSGFTLSYIGIIRNEAVGWVPTIDRAFPYLYLGVFLGNVLTLVPALRDLRMRRAAWFLLGGFAVLGLLLLTRVVRLSQAPGDWRSIIWSALVVAPLALLAILDWGVYWRRIGWDDREGSLSWWSPILSASFITAIFTGYGAARSGALISGLGIWAGVLASSWFLHVAIFLLAFAVLEVLRVALQSFKPSLRFIAAHLVIWLAIALVLRGIGAPALSFDGVGANLWAMACAAPFALMIAAVQLRSYRDRVPADLSAMLVRIAPGSRTLRVVFGVVLVALVYYVPKRIEAVDWNFVFQRFWAVLVWVMAAITFTSLARHKHVTRGQLRIRPALRSALTIGCCSVVLLFALAHLTSLWKRLGHREIASALQNYSGLDVSFQVASMVPQALVWDRTSDEYYALLRRNTLISKPVAAPNLELANLSAPLAGPKPNIFVIVADSLRPDYLSPYNSKVDFTPEIEAFARESIVFRNAFTPYGGTGLAEPVVWSGVRMPNRHYVQPFSNVNTLEKLLKAGSYRRFLTRDQVVAGLLQQWPTDTNLNEHVSYWTEYDFEVTLREFKSKLQMSAPGPVFLFTQPQNLHAVAIYQRQQAGYPLRRAYPGFRERYADEVNRFDQLFGEFVAFLKERGLYENSVIVLTADHGDQLGEFGLYGHSASLNPPVIRIPLLIHIPPALKSKFEVDTDRPAFLSDISPTMYRLLGVSGLNSDPLFGRSLVREPGENEARMDHYVLQSSYAPVFGVLGGDGETLYIADALARRQSYYRLTDDPHGLKDVIDPDVQQRNQQIVRDYIEHLNRVYGISPDRK